MSSFDLLREPLEKALCCARRIAELSIYQLGRDVDSFRQEFRFLLEDLPVLNSKAIAAFCGDHHGAIELNHVLARVQKDALEMAEWAVRARDELHELFIACTPATAAAACPQYGEAHNKTFRAAEQRRQDVFASCNRAHETASRICTAKDREAKEAGAEAPPQKVAEHQQKDTPDTPPEQVTPHQPEPALSGSQEPATTLLTEQSMSDISPLTRIELLLDKITTWQRLGPRGALLYQEIESVRRDRELLGADGLYLRRRPDLDPDEAKDVEDCTAALRDIAQHGDAVTSYVEGAGIPSGPLALFVRTPDFSLIPGALEVLCRARAVAPPQDTPVGEETATDDATPDESTAEDDAEDDPPPGKIPPERRTILLTKEEAALARRPGRGSVPRAGGGDRPGD